MTMDTFTNKKQNMHTPTKAQWQLVIDNFKKVLPFAPRILQLDMSEGRVNSDDHECGTIHCAAGWYAIATLVNELPLNYNDGANSMAAHLGFDGRDELQYWAARSSTIWGNRYGAFMFTEPYAYGFTHGDLSDIVAHLEGVRDRSPD